MNNFDEIKFKEECEKYKSEDKTIINCELIVKKSDLQRFQDEEITENDLIKLCEFRRMLDVVDECINQNIFQKKEKDEE